jgi:tRNA nucleotidyltransferase (CCA-adding enzyme)
MGCNNVAALLDRHPAAPLLRAIGRQAREEETPAAVVGGVVRDLLLGILSQDIDIVVEGDAVALAGKLAQGLGGTVLRTSAFGTAALQVGSLKIDLASARTERYPQPGALPEVYPATLRQDMERRDFTVNAMAIMLSPENFGQLLDYFAAIDDLAAKKLRVLHPASFSDDPTRLLRGMRLAHRLGFEFEAETRRLLVAAVQDKVWRTVSISRLARETELVFAETRWLELCVNMDAIGIFAPLLGGGLSKEKQADLGRVDDTVAYLAEHGLTCRRLPVIALLLSDSGNELVHTLLGPGKAGQKLLNLLPGIAKVRSVLADPAARLHQIFLVLAEFPPAVLAYICIICQNKMEQLQLKRYIEELRKLRPLLSGAEIAALTGGGPVTGAIRQHLLCAKLDGDVATKKEEIALVKALLASAPK